MKRIKVKVGDCNNYLKVTGYTTPDWSKAIRRKLICICICGKTTEVSVAKFKSGHTKSCGCYKEKKFKERVTKHGLSTHPLYEVYCSMKQRCYNPNNKAVSYKNKGIKICEEWLNDFLSFYDWALENGWEKGLHIDRIDSNGHYEPDNCQFLDPVANYSKVHQDFKTRLEYEKRILYLESLLKNYNIPF